MMNQTTIFVSSSSDMLEEERMCLKDFEKYWNLNKHPDNPIQIIKWELLNKSRTLNQTFQSGINPYIINSDLVIFVFSHRLGVHTNEEYKLAKKHNKYVRILLKEPVIDSLHKQSRKWLGDFVKLRKFIESIQGKVYTGKGPIKSISDFELQLTHCIEEYINREKKDMMCQDPKKIQNVDIKIIANSNNVILSIPPEYLNTELFGKLIRIPQNS